MKELVFLILCTAVSLSCGDSPSTNNASNSTNATDTGVIHDQGSTGGGQAATSPTPGPPQKAEVEPGDEKKVVEVRFPKGSSEASYTDSFSGYGVVDYELAARADQQMTVEITSSDDDRASFTVMRDGLAIDNDASQVTGWTGILPADSKYTVRVGQVRAFARRDEKPVKYSIRIRIE